MLAPLVTVDEKRKIFLIGQECARSDASGCWGNAWQRWLFSIGAKAVQGENAILQGMGSCKRLTCLDLNPNDWSGGKLAWLAIAGAIHDIAGALHFLTLFWATTWWVQRERAGLQGGRGVPGTCGSRCDSPSQ